MTDRRSGADDISAPASVWDDVVGQPGAVAQLRRAATDPVHAYLFVGPPGSTKHEAARAFAAAVLSGDDNPGGRGARLARAGEHPDVREVERTGPYITKPQAEDIVRWAALAPVEGDRKVLVLHEFHLVQDDAAAALLKTIEEPPASTTFLVLADFVPPPLITIASRCVRIDFRTIPDEVLTAQLLAEGIDVETAGTVGRRGGRQHHPRSPSHRGPGARRPPALVRRAAAAPRRHGGDRHAARRGRAGADRPARPPRSSSGTPPRPPSSTPALPSSANEAAAASCSRNVTAASFAVIAPTSCAAGWPCSPPRIATPWQPAVATAERRWWTPSGGSTGPSRRSASTTPTNLCCCNPCSGRSRPRQAGSSSAASAAASSAMGSSPRIRPTASSAARASTASAKA